MTDKTTEALKLAEQSLGEYHGKLMREVCNKVITETLAEPVKQEPVAWVNAERNTITWEKIYPNMEPLYAAPVSAKMQGDCTLAAVLAEREACAVCPSWDTVDDAIAAEREACAKVCLKTGIKHPQQTGQEACAAAIRARGEK